LIDLKKPFFAIMIARDSGLNLMKKMEAVALVRAAE
jgi:hypothetical protein